MGNYNKQKSAVIVPFIAIAKEDKLSIVSIVNSIDSPNWSKIESKLEFTTLLTSTNVWGLKPFRSVYDSIEKSGFY
jgi:hypothetical protein